MARWSGGPGRMGHGHARRRPLPVRRGTGPISDPDRPVSAARPGARARRASDSPKWWAISWRTVSSTAVSRAVRIAVRADQRAAEDRDLARDRGAVGAERRPRHALVEPVQPGARRRSPAGPAVGSSSMTIATEPSRSANGAGRLAIARSMAASKIGVDGVVVGRTAGVGHPIPPAKAPSTRTGTRSVASRSAASSTSDAKPAATSSRPDAESPIAEASRASQAAERRGGRRGPPATVPSGRARRGSPRRRGGPRPPAGGLRPASARRRDDRRRATVPSDQTADRGRVAQAAGHDHRPERRGLDRAGAPVRGGQEERLDPARSGARLAGDRVGPGACRFGLARIAPIDRA